MPNASYIAVPTLRRARDEPKSPTYIALWVGDSTSPLIRCLACGTVLRPLRNNDYKQVRASLQFLHDVRSCYDKVELLFITGTGMKSFLFDAF